MYIMSQEENTKITQSKKGISISGAVIIAGVIIAAAILFTRSGASSDSLASATGAAVTGGSDGQLLNPIADSDFITGAKKPKVTIVEFSDFGCSFCARFHPTLQQVVDTYPEDVAWVYRHLPYRNKDAALASECVGQRLGDEAFWVYSTKLFTLYPDITKEVLASEAEILGLGADEFAECIASEETDAAVSADAAEAQLLGASGTPFSLIVTDDGRTFPLRGAVAFEQIQQIVDVLVK